MTRADSSIKQLSDEYQRVINAMAVYEEQAASAMLSGDFTEYGWFQMDFEDGVNPVQDWERIHQAFTRDGEAGPNERVSEMLGNDGDTGTAGEYTVAQIEASELSAAERAFRLRYMTKTRAAVHAGCRHLSNQQEGGAWLRSHRAYLESMLKRSTAKRSSGS